MKSPLRFHSKFDLGLQKSAASAALLLLFSGLLHSCSGSSSSAINTRQGSNIVGGTVVDSTDPIAHVMVKILSRFANGDIGTCSGTIISHQYLLTAAHCFSSRTEGEAEPERLLLAGNIEASIRGVFIHPNYDFRKRRERFDIALVRFGSANVKQIANLPKPGELPQALNASRTFVAGFGRQTELDFESAGTLRKTSATLLSEAFGYSEQLVFSSATSGTCFGDSGGPFYEQENSTIKVFGILSREAPGNNGCVGSDIHTKTVIAMPWIAKVMSGEITPRAPLSPNRRNSRSNNGGTNRQYGI